MNILFYLLPKNEVTYIEQDDLVARALRIIHKNGYQAVPVVDREGHYVGTVSEGDFLWDLIEDYHMDMEAMRKTRVSGIRKRWDYKAVSIDANMAELDEYIMNQNFVPVVDGRNVFIGIVTRKEIFAEMLRRKRECEGKKDGQAS
ncbi:MAG: CBS domain-containing protein [Clostridiales bacterium]|nr:CBS domain-containing protein [Clostridiales bacterium]